MRKLLLCSVAAAAVGAARPAAGMDDIFKVARDCNYTALERMVKRARSLATVKDNYGATPLHHVARSGKKTKQRDVMQALSCVKLLLLAGCPVDVRDKYRKTPLHFAAESNSGFVAKFLMDNGADPKAHDKYGSTPLHSAARGSIDVMKLLIAKKVDVNRRNESGETPLHRARGAEAVKLLVKHGADVNAKSNFGSVPLHNVYKGETAEALLDAKADPDIRNEMGDAPIHKAARFRHTGVLEILLRKKADANATDRSGRTPIALAQAEKERVALNQNYSPNMKARMAEEFDRIIEILKNYGAK